MKTESIIYTEHELPHIINHIIPLLNGVNVVTLRGPLGAGKTTLMQALLHALGVQDSITSPTFAYVHTYRGAQGMLLHHFDLYRIGSVDAFIDAGFDEYINDTHACSFIEWPEVIAPLLEHIPTVQLTLDYEGLDKRKLIIELKK